MRIESLVIRSFAVLIVIGSLAPASAVAQHVHGVVELGIVVEGSTVAVSLNAPLSDVVGFEHAPTNDEQVQSIQQAAAMLSDTDNMFGMTDAANCKASEASVEGPAFLTRYFEHEDSAAAEHDDDHHDAHDSHDSEHHDDETEASDDHEHHDEDEESHGHDHHDEEEHSEINASYEWSCGNVSKLDALMLLFTGKFASVETIEIQILTSAGARVLTEKGRVESVSLSSP